MIEGWINWHYFYTCVFNLNKVKVVVAIGYYLGWKTNKVLKNNLEAGSSDYIVWFSIY